METNNSKSSISIDKNNKSKYEKNTIIKKKDYPYSMNENQMYEMFLKIYKKTDSEMNELSYLNAIKIDKRTYLEYYLSLLRTKHLFIFSIWPTFDYNSQIIKIFLFFFNLAFSFLLMHYFSMMKQYIKSMKIKVHLTLFIIFLIFYYLQLYQDL